MNSVLSQSYRAFEIIVINDGSTDETAEVLAGFGKKLVCLHTPNSGPGSARNVGLAHASGDYVVFLDSDDVLLPWALETYAEVIERCAAPAFILSRPLMFKQYGELAVTQAISATSLEVEQWEDYLQAASARYPISIAAAIRTSVLRRHGFTLSSRTSEDQDLFLRMGQEKGFVFIREPQLYAYRVNQSSLTYDMPALRRGLKPLLDNERTGVYPGGKVRQYERSIVLSRIIKYKLTRCLKYGDAKRAYQVFMDSLPYLLRVNPKAAYGLFGLLANSLKGGVVQHLKGRLELEKAHSKPS